MVIFSAVKIFDVDRRFIDALIERGNYRFALSADSNRDIKAQEFMLHESKLLTLMRPNCTVCNHRDFLFSPFGNFDALH